MDATRVRLRHMQALEGAMRHWEGSSVNPTGNHFAGR